MPWSGGGTARDAGATFLTAFIVEKSLSMDNIFVFVVIFRFFAVPLMYQYRVLFWGILGAIAMRLAFILAGVELIHRFAWIAPLFGAFLIYTAYKLARHSGVEVHPENNVVLKIARRLLPVAAATIASTATASSSAKAVRLHHADVPGAAGDREQRRTLRSR